MRATAIGSNNFGEDSAASSRVDAAGAELPGRVRFAGAAIVGQGGCAHLGLARPFGELYLSHELGNEPRGRVLVFHSLVERFLVGA